MIEKNCLTCGAFKSVRCPCLEYSEWKPKPENCMAYIEELEARVIAQDERIANLQRRITEVSHAARQLAKLANA